MNANLIIDNIYKEKFEMKYNFNSFNIPITKKKFDDSYIVTAQIIKKKNKNLNQVRTKERKSFEISASVLSFVFCS